MLRRLLALKSRKARYLDVSPPKAMAAGQHIGIACIMRNVAPYIEEWLHFHFLAGVNHVLAYENLSDDTTRKILESYPPDKVTVIPWALHGSDEGTDRYLSRQVTAYAHAVTTFGASFTRLAFIDVDEFLVPVGHDSIPAALAAIGHHSNLSLPWLMFGHAGHDMRPEGGVLRNYTHRAVTPYEATSPLLRFKCIVDPCRTTTVGVHRFRTTDLGDQTANTRGEIVGNGARKQRGFFATEHLQLNHYYSLSRAETEAKIARGPVANASQAGYAARVREKITEIERRTVEDLSAMDFLSAAKRRTGPT
jgi:hypothetical protein